MPEILQTPLESIVVPENRQRKTFTQEKLDELSVSMDRPSGLLHPIITRMVEGTIVLVSGERRLRTLRQRAERGISTRCGTQLFPPGTAPTLDIGDLTETEAVEAELEENIRRVDLTWQERAAAEAFLHSLRAGQKEAQGLKQTILDTAVEARGYDNPATVSGTIQVQVSHNIILAKHLDDPDVAKAKTAKEAIKVVQRKAEAQKRVELAAQFDTGTAASDTGLRANHSLLEGDARDLLKSLPDGGFQVLLTDPPYGIDADSFGEQSGQGHDYEDSLEYFSSLMDTLAEESYRVCATSAHAYVFCDPRNFSAVELTFTMAGWKVWPTPLIWAKNTGMLPRPEHGPRRMYECIMFASKGEKTTNAVRGDVLLHSSVSRLIHGAQKPVSLYRDLLERSTAPGDSILDPFAGTGTIFAAANCLRLRATGIELNEEYLAAAKLRMDKRGDSLDEEEDDEEIADVDDSALRGLDDIIEAMK